MSGVRVDEKLSICGGQPVRTAPWPAWPQHGPEDERALLDVLHSGKWFLGEKVVEFERTFADYHQAKYGVSVCNGTVAIQVALEAIGIAPGDEIIVPSYTFIATASAVSTTGGIPVFVDVDADTYLIDPDAVEAAITEQTKAIIAVHIAGQPADLDRLTEIAGKHSIRLIEDSAQAHNAAWKGRKVGAIGDLGTFSFQASKNLNSGEGGFITTDDCELDERAWSIHNCGRAREGQWYEHPLIGGNYRMSEFHAALLLAQMRNLDEQTARRGTNGPLLTSLLSEIDGIRPLKVDERVTTHAYHLYAFRYDSQSFGGVPRDRFLEALRAEGVPCAAGYRPLYKEPAFAARYADCPFDSAYFGGKPDYAKVSNPVCERICAEEAVWLTQNMLLGPQEDMHQIAAAVAKVRENASQLK